MAALRVTIFSGILAALVPFAPALAGDFHNPSAAALDGTFRTSRMNMEVNRFSLAQRAAAAAVAGNMVGAAGIDEYQNTGIYQNVIWVPLNNIGDGNTISVAIGESLQSSDGATLNATNTVAGCSVHILNAPSECEQN